MNSSSTNITNSSTNSNASINQSSQIKNSTSFKNAYFSMEIIASVWFTLDYILRLYSTPLKRIKFILIPFNIVDMIINLLFIEIIVTTLCFPEANDYWKSAVRMFQILRIVRVIKTSAGIKALGFTIKKSIKDLVLLISIIFSTSILLGSLAYLVEKDLPETLFDSLPNSFYWAIITYVTR